MYASKNQESHDGIVSQSTVRVFFICFEAMHRLKSGKGKSVGQSTVPMFTWKWLLNGASCYSWYVVCSDVHEGQYRWYSHYPVLGHLDSSQLYCRIHRECQQRLSSVILLLKTGLQTCELQ